MIAADYVCSISAHRLNDNRTNIRQSVTSALAKIESRYVIYRPS